MPFQIVDHLEYTPGCCKGCGLTRPGRYVDTLEFDEANARVYYCEHCVKDWALHLGILSGEVKIVERVREPNAEEVGRFVLEAFRVKAEEANHGQHIAVNAALLAQTPPPEPKPRSPRRSGGRRKKAGA